MCKTEKSMLNEIHLTWIFYCKIDMSKTQRPKRKFENKRAD